MYILEGFEIKAIETRSRILYIHRSFKEDKTYSKYILEETVLKPLVRVFLIYFLSRPKIQNLDLYL